MINTMNTMRGWVDRSDWRVFLVAQIQSWIVMSALLAFAYAIATGQLVFYLASAALIVVEVPLGATFMTQWRFDLNRYMNVAQQRTPRKC
ncbi:hypothetical protein FDI59_gp106 [Mycobacterium phage Yoshi]|uniref:Uncharacterized protein n=1 Tax=Mycobacterium phage Yoshi TaxID=2920891 RepID=G1BSL3_9CAUD|nr:hypothetical protein FDI59_gp106 [Mycobacterium phage Yoshi]AEK07853.1 hypothetical protein YOSHI_106 [Mycobacterium phage Yoshi]